MPGPPDLSSPADPASGSKRPSDTTRFESYDDISSVRASSMLKMSLHGPRNAADDLIDHLETVEGPRWMEILWKKEPFSLSILDIPSVLGGGAGLDVLMSLKDKGKEMVKKPAHREGYLCGLAAYYIAIAAALVQHGELITRTPRHDVNQILIELASVAPTQWKELFMKAAAR